MARKRRLGLTASEYTKIGKAFRDAMEACRERYFTNESTTACIEGVKETSRAMNKAGFQIGRAKK